MICKEDTENDGLNLTPGIIQKLIYFRHDEKDRQRFCETTPVPPSGLSGIYKRKDITKAAYLKQNPVVQRKVAEVP